MSAKWVSNAGIGAGEETQLRAQLVTGLGAGTETRATALQKVAASVAAYNKLFNPAFVQMQYFGYLSRNPNDAPDGDFNGLNFRLNKLNQFNGNFIRSEMLRSFVLATEYRQRFGQDCIAREFGFLAEVK